MTILRSPYSYPLLSLSFWSYNQQWRQAYRVPLGCVLYEIVCLIRTLVRLEDWPNIVDEIRQEVYPHVMNIGKTQKQRTNFMNTVIQHFY